MREEELRRTDPLGPLDWLRLLPHVTAASSDRLGWVGLEAARYQAASAAELNLPAVTHHLLILFARPPEELDMRYEGVKRHVPPPPARFLWCRPAARPGCGRAGAGSRCSSSWSRG